MNEISYDTAASLFKYDRTTGVLSRKKTTSSNARSGSEAGYLNKSQGYRRIMIGGKNYLVHRIIWLLATGTYPTASIDHINRDRSDNRWSNLRLADKTQQNGNAKRRSDNTSGFRGVHFSRGGYVAQIRNKSKRIYLGRYKTAKDAAAVFEAAAKKYFGEFYSEEAEE